MGEDTTIQLFFWTSAILAGFEAMKAAGWRVWAFSAIAATLGLIGILWSWLKQVYPPLTNAVADIATSPPSWFVLLVLGLVLLSVTGRKRRPAETVTTSFQPDDLARLQKVEIALEKVPDRELVDLQIMGCADALNEVKKQQSNILQTQASQQRIMDLVSASLDRFKNLDRSTFLLATAATEKFYQQQLGATLDWLKTHPLAASFNSDEERANETERINEFFNDLQSKLAPSHWNAEFYRVLKNAEVEADHQLPKTPIPEGSNPFYFRRFHIACIQYERVGQWVERALDEAKAQERQMQQMLRERPDIHK